MAYSCAHSVNSTHFICFLFCFSFWGGDTSSYNVQHIDITMLLLLKQKPNFCGMNQFVNARQTMKKGTKESVKER